MNPPDPRWRDFPVLRELHDQWWRARGNRLGESTRPFSRDWEQLLDDAGLVSAELRTEAERDVRNLAAAGLLRLRAVRFRPHLLDRILLPVECETHLARLFGDPLESEASTCNPADFAWAPELSFLRETPAGPLLDDFLAIHRFLVQGGRERPIVPIKERSLHIFGDEKRLDALTTCAAFRTGRVTLDQLRCVQVPEPLGWRRGTNPKGPVIVLENAATWDSYVRWNQRAAEFSAVIYGKGLAFVDSVARLPDIFEEIGGSHAVQYFGDLDPPGLEIPWRAGRRAQGLGLPAITPHLWSYRTLLGIPSGAEAPYEGNPAGAECLAWLQELAEPARALFARGRRLAQEHLGWELLIEAQVLRGAPGLDSARAD